MWDDHRGPIIIPNTIERDWEDGDDRVVQEMATQKMREYQKFLKDQSMLDVMVGLLVATR